MKREPKPGDYVLATKWSDGDPRDPFCVGYFHCMLDDLGSDDGNDCDPDRVADRFGISRAMAAEIMWANDDGLVSEHAYIDGRWTPDPDHAEKRWLAMKQWVSKMLGQAKGGAE